MTKGFKGSGRSGSKTVATIGYVSSVPVKSTVSFKGANGEGSYQTKSRFSYGDKQSGCYGRETTKEKVSAGAFHWKNGTTGTKSEYTQSSTVRVGDKTGYTEVYNEQRVRNVTYDKNSCSTKNYITYNNGYGGRGSDSESDRDDGGRGSDSESDSDGSLSGDHDNDSDGSGSYGGSDSDGYSYDSDY